MGLDHIASPIQATQTNSSRYADVASNSAKKAPPKEKKPSTSSGNSRLTTLGGKKKKRISARARSLLLSSDGSSSSEEDSHNPEHRENTKPEAEPAENKEKAIQAKTTAEKEESTHENNEVDRESLTEAQQDEIFAPFFEEQAEPEKETQTEDNTNKEIQSPPTPGNLSSDLEDRIIDVTEEGEIKSSSTSPESLIDKEFNKIHTSTPGDDLKKNAARTWEERESPGEKSPRNNKSEKEKKRASSSRASDRSSGIPRPRGNSLEAKERKAMSDSEGRGRTSKERKGNSKNSHKYQERSLSQVKKKLKS